MSVTNKPHLHQDWIDSHAYGIVKALQKGGFTTYLVGGCVRDLLLNINPKDYDIATMAHPPQVKRMIYMSFIIGKRFRLVLVKRDQQQFEVATFRREVRPEDLADPNSPAGDNIFGTPEEDARRRDFTINGLFYDPIQNQLIDYVEGLPDIDARILRMIGDPKTRLQEDPIRSLRGLRLAHKLGFVIEPSLRAAMQECASELQKSVLPRRREEILKLLRLEEPDLALLECYDLGILRHVIPTLHDLLESTERREIFLGYFNSLKRMVADPADTTQLFGWLIFAMLKTAHDTPGPDRTEPLTLESEIFQRLMRDELGMYKFEQAAVMQAMEILPHLTRHEDFKRRGERRQLALMKNEGFPLALALADADHLLTGRQLIFWRAARDKMSEELTRLRSEMKTKKRRRPRRRKGQDEFSGREMADDLGDEAVDSDDLDDSESDSDLDSDPDSDLDSKPDSNPRAAPQA